MEIQKWGFIVSYSKGKSVNKYLECMQWRLKKIVNMGRKEELNLLKRYKIDPFKKQSLFPSNETMFMELCTP